MGAARSVARTRCDRLTRVDLHDARAAPLAICDSSGVSTDKQSAVQMRQVFGRVFIVCCFVLVLFCLPVSISALLVSCSH